MSKSCCTMDRLCEACQERMWRYYLAEEDYATMMEIIAEEEQSLEEGELV